MIDQVRGVLSRLGEVAHLTTLRRSGLPDAVWREAVKDGRIRRLRPGWYASSAADRDQCRAVLPHGRLGCVTALARYGVWSGDVKELHLQVPSNAARLQRVPPNGVGSVAAVWPPRLEDRRRRELRVANLAQPVVHWCNELDPPAAIDWLASPSSALAQAIRCLDSEHAQASVDSAIAERMLRRAEVVRIVEAAPRRTGVRVDAYCGRLESGAESLFVRRLVAAGYRVEPQIQLAGHGRFDGLIEGCVLYEVDGWAHHRSRERFFGDRDRTLVAQSFGVPVVRVTAAHVRDDWPTVIGAVARVVADARALREH